MAIAATPYSKASIRWPSVLKAFRCGWKGGNPAHQPPKRCPAPPPGTGVGRTRWLAAVALFAGRRYPLPRKMLKGLSCQETSKSPPPNPSHVRAPRSLSPADAHVLERRHARDRGRPRAPPAHARLRGRAGARRGGG